MGAAPGVRTDLASPVRLRRFARRERDPRKASRMLGGVTSQREIESAVREALRDGRLRGHGNLRAKVTLTIEAIGLKHAVEDEIRLG